ncbi:MAG: hydantoinase/carbamoylase family amidase [Proteobacteria bacterium]|nr:hydantoinase/carbamoylase family amidase [Pseudomonadota bacterium]
MAGDAVRRAVAANLGLAEDLFARLAAASRDEVGITRPSYGEREQAALDLVAEAGRGLGLGVRTDYAGNLYLTLAGRDRARPPVLAGSHLDSVPKGGNYDGAAGVLGALVAVAALRRAGVTPAEDVTVVGFRGEESPWFAVHHIGSRAALGLLPPEELESARRVDTGRTLAEHMAELGCDLAALRARKAFLDPRRVRAFYEIHIEQGPVLEHDGIPVGIVTGIRGNLRARHARCVGAYAHSGATPRRLRHDAALAVAEFMGVLEAEWLRLEAEGRDLVLTFGKVGTNPEAHTHSKVPGEMFFTIDARSHEADTLDRMQEFALAQARAIGARRGVAFELGPLSRVKPATMDAGLRAGLHAAARALDIRASDIASGGGHDAGDFANAGVPTAMIFVRNPHGSHNPDEHMEMADFEQAVAVLAAALAG